jgi:hypothetical protein
VDGSFGTWTYILSDLYPMHDSPALTLGSVLTLLPVVHKYDFSKLLTRLVAFVKESTGELHHDPKYRSTYIVRWLEVSERLQLDDLRELCLDRLRDMTGEELQTATTVEVVVGSGADKRKRRRRAVVRRSRGWGRRCAARCSRSWRPSRLPLLMTMPTTTSSPSTQLPLLPLPPLPCWPA